MPDEMVPIQQPPTGRNASKRGPTGRFPVKAFLLVLLAGYLLVNFGFPWLMDQWVAHTSFGSDADYYHGYSGQAKDWLNHQYWNYFTNPSTSGISQAMSVTLSPALLLTATFAVFAMIGGAALQTKLIEVQREGLTARRKGAARAVGIAWEDLSRVDITNAWGGFGYKNYNLVFHTTQGATLRIAWRDVIASHQGPQLLDALKTWAPAAISRCDLVVPGLEDTQTNYTQMWLQYFSAPARRERSADLDAGVVVCDGKYTIAGKLSGGGHGTTYLAVANHGNGSAAESELGDLVIKEYVLPVHRGSLTLDRTIEKLNQEAAILRRIDHPQIVSLRDSFIEDYRGYLVMEFVQGVSLKDLVDREGPQQESFVCRLSIQMCEILSYLHALTPPVIHRDFTPDNLILQDNMEVKLVDFNVAHELEGAVTATVVGKHSYLPPEQFRGKPVPHSDIYALGCTLHFLLTGADPEPISTSHPRLQRADLSRELDAIVAKATALDAGMRYENAGAMKADLLPLLEGQRA